MASNGIPISQLAALQDGSRELFHQAKGDFIDWQEYFDYPVLRRSVGNKLRFEGGTAISFNRRGTGADNFVWTLPWGADDVSTDREILKWTAAMCFAHTAIQWDEREMDLNQGPEQLVDLYALDFAQQMERASKRLEDALSLIPQNATDTKVPMGLFNHLCMGPTGTYEAGFKGTTARYLDWSGTGSTHTTTTIGGLDRSTSDLLANWTSLYSGKINKATLTIIKLAMMKSGFRAHPLGHQGNMAKMAPDVMFMPPEQAVALSDYMDEAGQKSDVLAVKGIPVESVAAWDPTSSSHHAVRSYAPIMGVRFRTRDRVAGVGFHVLRGRWMKQSKASQIPDNHNGVQTFYDVACQQTCPDPRSAGFVLHTTISA